MEKGKKACTLLLGALRLMSMAATLSATIVTITSRERVIVFNFPVDAKYHYTPSLKFFAIANGIGSVYSLAVLFIPATKLRRLVVAFDVVITMLLTASASAALAVGHVARKGDSHAGWIPICGQVPKFCDHVLAALILGFCGVFIYMFLLLHAIHTFIKPILL
ncbi:CASP-like protein 1C1 [Cinnamomum micranthum f. kanehirae]|uniref:CASP-like protein n=1 Tax=Cinnamomum micranthum f. kanehirae TaxID=337451 RepID=A0A443Q397_9MAGN|nr:CASP-like protein 1C1 [Cinnamomum micranthum f. kanehirae]